MKKTVFILLLAALSVQAFSQTGDLSVGAKGGYVYSPNYYRDILYGIDVAYHLSYPFEVAFTAMMNPKITSYRNINDEEKELAIYSASLDLRLYLIQQREWGTGPALGGQYYVVNDKTAGLGSDNTLGFNLGWHFRVNLTDYVKLNGGWRYTNAKFKDPDSVYNNTFDVSYNLFYLGVAYTFELR
jgi:opacity protein-like surface antigen